MFIELPTELEERLRAEAERRGLEIGDYVRPALETLANQPAAQLRERTAKPIWETAAELLADLPEEELARLPADGSEQIDHYVYGSPKREAP